VATSWDAMLPHMLSILGVFTLIPVPTESTWLLACKPHQKEARVLFPTLALLSRPIKFAKWHLALPATKGSCIV
jgi:hypothetical protein